MSTAIRELRAAVGLTQEKFAQALGITITSIARYETSERTPRAGTLHALAKVADGAGKADIAGLFRSFCEKHTAVVHLEVPLTAAAAKSLGIKHANDGLLVILKLMPAGSRYFSAAANVVTQR